MGISPSKGVRSDKFPDSETLYSLYHHKRLSIRQTAKATGVSYGAIQRRLVKIGLARTQSEGQMRHQRTSFDGDSSERAYLLGLRAGDLNVWRKTPNTIEARVSTTHPAMADLFSRSFGRFGQIMADAGKAYLPRRYRWQLRIHVDSSFEFLIPKPSAIPHIRPAFYQFLGGYSDSEGCWSIYFSRNQVRTCWSVESKDVRLLREIRDWLRREGFHPLFYSREIDVGRKAAKNKSGQTSRVGCKWVLRICRKREVESLSGRLLLISRHEEKIWKMNLVSNIREMTKEEIARNLKAWKSKIKSDVADYEKKAEIDYKKARAGPRPMGSSARLQRQKLQG